MKKKYIIFSIISIQVLVIGILANSIYNKHSVLGSVSVNPIQSNSLTTNEEIHDLDELKYFYEPKSDTIIKPEVIFPGLENIRYTINKDGFNQSKDYPISKEKGIYRIATIGDSFTFGQHVNTADNYPSQLENMLNEKLSCPTIQKFEVLNLGVGGYDIQYTVERFTLRGKQFNPDLVIWLLVSDDFVRIQELLLPKVNEYVKKAKENGTYQQHRKNGTYYTEWIRARDEVVKELGGEKNVLSLQKKYLNQFTDLFPKNIVMSILPPFQQKHEALLKSVISKKPNIFYFDQLPNIYDIPKATLPDSHPSKTGHTLIANAFMEYLVTSHILPCSRK